LSFVARLGYGARAMTTVEFDECAGDARRMRAAQSISDVRQHRIFREVEATIR
jgi:hypothetical protein